jgi:hypothetical protein
VDFQRATGGTQDGFPKLDHLGDHFVGRFEDHEFLTRGQGHNGIGRDLHVLNQIGIYDERNVVQPGELDHKNPESRIQKPKAKSQKPKAKSQEHATR